jgi:integrase
MRGHIRKRGNSWSVVVDHDRDEDGKRRQKWHSGYRTKRDAERALTEILNRIGSGTYVDPGRQTMTEYLREWLVAIQRTVRPGTWTSDRSNVARHVVPRLGGRELRQLGASHLNVLYSELLDEGRCDGAGGLSPRSVRYIHTILHRALRDAVRWGKLARNPAEMADPPRSRAPEMKTWQKEELRRFLASVEDDRLYAAWLLVSTTGLRRGELLGLRWSDLDFEAGRAAIHQTLSSVGGKITFSTPKTTKSRRSIALDPATLAALRRHRDAQDAERAIWAEVYADLDLVFCREDGTPLRPDSITRRFHDLRSKPTFPPSASTTSATPTRPSGWEPGPTPRSWPSGSGTRPSGSRLTPTAMSLPPWPSRLLTTSLHSSSPRLRPTEGRAGTRRLQNVCSRRGQAR